MNELGMLKAVYIQKIKAMVLSIQTRVICNQSNPSLKYHLNKKCTAVSLVVNSTTNSISNQACQATMIETLRKTNKFE